jgi:hypothetical protein
LAREIAAQRERDELVTEKVTIGDLLDDLILDVQTQQKGVNWARILCKHLRGFFGKLKEYVAHRQSLGKAPATINNELALLRRSMKLGAEATPPKSIRRSMLLILWCERSGSNRHGC